MAARGTGKLLFLVLLLASNSARAMTRSQFDDWWESWRTAFDLKWPDDFCKGFPYYSDCVTTRPERLKTKLPTDMRQLSAASNPGSL